MHSAPATWLTQFKERQAKQRKNGSHLCYGKRCAVHMQLWDWMAAR